MATRGLLTAIYFARGEILVEIAVLQGNEDVDIIC